MAVIKKEETGLPYFIMEWAGLDMQYLAGRVQNEVVRRDAVIIYAGEEGSGKTTLATQHAYYLSKLLNIPFGLDNYYFTPLQLYNAVQDANKPPGTAFIYDEGVTGLLAKQSMAKMHVKLQIMFSTCRSKRYPIFVLIPRFREIPDWLSIDRSISMYKTYNKRVKDVPDKPGFYVGYDRFFKRKLYILEKAKRYDLIAKDVVSTQEGTFSGWPFSPSSQEPPFLYEEYEEYKRKSLKEEDVSTDTISKRQLMQRNKLIHYLSRVHTTSRLELQRITGLSPTVIRDILDNP